MNKILHLVVTYYWFDKFVNGEKDEEYREITPRWEKRFKNEFTHLCLHRGYTNETLSFEIESIRKGKPKPGMAPAEWMDKELFVIKGR